MTGKEMGARNEGSLVPREVARTPFEALRRSINRDFDSMFKRFFSDDVWPAWPAWPAKGESAGSKEFWPLVNVTEKDGVIQVEAEVPGMDSKELDVSVVENMLTLKGEHKEEKEEKGKETYRREFSYGSFERNIPLPARVQADKAEATFEKGILRLKLPVLQEDRERVKKIPIKVA